MAKDLAEEDENAHNMNRNLTEEEMIKLMHEATDGRTLPLGFGADGVHVLDMPGAEWAMERLKAIRKLQGLRDMNDLRIMDPEAYEAVRRGMTELRG
jgi:hypothetical protein